MFANYWTNRKMQTFKESSMKKFRDTNLNIYFITS